MNEAIRSGRWPDRPLGPGRPSGALAPETGGAPATVAALRPLIFVLIVCILALPNTLLDSLGWHFTATGSGAAWQKFHPATYVGLTAAAVALLSADRRFWAPLTHSVLFFFAASAILLAIRSVFVNAGSSEEANGAIGLAVTNFVTPVCLLIVLPALRSVDAVRMAGWVRRFMLLSSAIAIAQAVLRFEVFFHQTGSQWRSSGLFNHPLDASTLTGVVLVQILLGERARGWTALRVGEVLVHALAMFTFASRAGLIGVPFILLISALLPDGEPASSPGLVGPSDKSRVRVARRFGAIAIFVIILGVSQLPIPIVQEGLARFNDDSGSSDARRAAVQLLLNLQFHDYVWGLDVGHLRVLLHHYKNTIAIESSWLQLTVLLGGIVVLPTALSLFAVVRRLWRGQRPSIRAMALYFFLVTATSLSFGSKNMLISTFLTFLILLRSEVSKRDAQQVPFP